MAVNVGEAEVAPGVVVGEAFVVESKEMQDRSLEIVHVDFVLGDVEAKIVGLTVSPGLGAASGHERGEGLGVVVAARLASEGWIGFNHGSAAEFTAPDDEGFVKEAVSFEVLNESGGGLRGLFAIAFGGAFDIGVSVPTGVVDINEPDPSLHHATGQKAGAGERVFVAVAAVEVDCFVGLFLEIHQFRGGTLEAGRHLVGSHPGGDFIIVDEGMPLGIELIDKIEGVLLQFA